MYIGKVQRGKTVTKGAFLMVKEPQGFEVLDITTSSPYIAARKLDYREEKPGYTRLKIEVTVKPGLPVGRVNETVTVRTNFEKRPIATLRVSGTVTGDVGVEPEALRFTFNGSERPGQGLVKKAYITNNNEASPLAIFSVRNPDGHLDLAFKPVIEGSKYEVTATLKDEARARGTNLGGRIVVTTNNPEQEEIIINYNVFYTNRTGSRRDRPAGPGRN